MGKKHRHDKNKLLKDVEEIHPPNPVPKLIVKIGGEATPERREESPLLVVPLSLEAGGGGVYSEDLYRHHPHKHKKKKKEKKKKKSHDKDRDREHKHHHKKRKRKEYANLEPTGSGASAYKHEYPMLEAGYKRDYLDSPPGGAAGGSFKREYSPQEAGTAVSQTESIVSRLPPLTGGVKREYADAMEATSGADYYSSGSGSSPQPPPAKRFCEDEPGLSPRREVQSRSCVAKQPKSSCLCKVLEYLLVMLEKRDVSRFFCQPVSDTFAPGYSSIIKEPMDFSTMHQKIEDGAYKSLEQFRYDFELICNNCMIYNLPDTIYYKTAKKLHQQGIRILAPDRIKALADHLPLIKELGPEQLGFDLRDEVPAEMSPDDEKDVSKVIEEIRSYVRRPPGRFEAIPDNIPPEDVHTQVKQAAALAAARLAKKKPNSHMGFLRQKQDGSTSLAIVTPTGGSPSERPVTLGQLIGRIKNGGTATATGLQGFKEDRRNVAKSVHPLYYGAFSSYGPAYDSTFANLTKQETELVYSTYGDDVGVAYAESIKNFSRNCEYASFIVDHLLDILTGNEHKKTTKYIEEQKMIRAEEETVRAAFERTGTVDFESLKSLADEGIDISFLDNLQNQYSERQSAAAAVKLEETATLLDNLRSVQEERLSGPPPLYLGQAPTPSQTECDIADRVQNNLVELVGQAKPRDVYLQLPIKK